MIHPLWALRGAIHARLGPQGRVEAAFAVSELAREAALAGLRMRHPEWDEARLGSALLKRLYGERLAERAIEAGAKAR